MAQNYMSTQSLISKLRSHCTRHYTILNNNIRSFGGTIQGALLIQRENTGRRLLRLQGGVPPNQPANEDPNPATLCNNPRTLHQLWREYKFGIDGRKAAETFTTKERNERLGGAKQKYYRRNVVWQCVASLVRGGDTAEMAIHKIQQCYGAKLSVTKIISRMLVDRRTGGHPNLN